MFLAREKMSMIQKLYKGGGKRGMKRKIEMIGKLEGGDELEKEVS